MRGVAAWIASEQWGVGAGERQIILLGDAGRARLNGKDMWLAQTTQTSSPFIDSLAGYPEWLVMGCATIVAVAAIWIVAKLLKWSLYVLMVLVLIGGLAATVWLVFEGV